ncbi:hypothetical protein N431DRAFT_210780 [Stipitochalara longipes BDJ]|nr:hypothetical protein N431DRAFT_210780 [Stipitochalara longipes BDJ]
MHNIALPLFYRDINLAQKFTSKELHCRFLDSLDLNPSLAPLIHTLCLTEFLGSGPSSPLPQALLLLPHLRSLHLQLGQMKQLDDHDIRNIFFGMPDLETLVIENTCRETHPNYLSDVFGALGSVDPAISSKIRSLTCRSDSDSTQLWFPANRLAFVDKNIFGNVLQRFPKLQALDLAHTPVDPKSLLAISHDARLHFLRITSCQDNDSSTLAQILATHPSVNSSLVVFDGSGVRFTQQETSTILECLPSSLRSLNLSSSTMMSGHVPQLQKLCHHLEELSLGYGLTMDDVEDMLMRPYFVFSAAVPRLLSNRPRNLKDKPEHELVLGPMRDAIAVCKLRRRLASVSSTHCQNSTDRSRVKFLNVSSLNEEEQGRITNSVILGEHSMPLKRIAASNISTEDSHVLQKLCGGCGWRDRWCNGMFWVEREQGV